MFLMCVVFFVIPVVIIMLMYYVSLFIGLDRPYKFKCRTYNAMVDLLKWYKYGVKLPGVRNVCPLCNVVKMSCIKCPWVVIEGYPCFSWQFEVKVSSIRHNPKDYPELVKRRIDMLERWLSLSKRSLF